MCTRFWCENDLSVGASEALMLRSACARVASSGTFLFTNAQSWDGVAPPGTRLNGPLLSISWWNCSVTFKSTWSLSNWSSFFLQHKIIHEFRNANRLLCDLGEVNAQFEQCDGICSFHLTRISTRVLPSTHTNRTKTVLLYQSKLLFSSFTPSSPKNFETKFLHVISMLTTKTGSPSVVLLLVSRTLG